MCQEVNGIGILNDDGGGFHPRRIPQSGARPDHPSSMGGAVGPAVVGAVSNARGLGMLPPWRANPAAIRQQIRETRALTSKPFGANLVLEFPREKRLEPVWKKAFASFRSSGETRPH